MPGCPGVRVRTTRRSSLQRHPLTEPRSRSLVPSGPRRPVYEEGVQRSAKPPSHRAVREQRQNSTARPFAHSGHVPGAQHHRLEQPDPPARRPNLRTIRVHARRSSPRRRLAHHPGDARYGGKTAIRLMTESQSCGVHPTSGIAAPPFGSRSEHAMTAPRPPGAAVEVVAYPHVRRPTLPATMWISDGIDRASSLPLGNRDRGRFAMATRCLLSAQVVATRTRRRAPRTADSPSYPLRSRAGAAVPHPRAREMQGVRFAMAVDGLLSSRMVAIGAATEPPPTNRPACPGPMGSTQGTGAPQPPPKVPVGLSRRCRGHVRVADDVADRERWGCRRLVCSGATEATCGTSHHDGGDLRRSISDVERVWAIRGTARVCLRGSEPLVGSSESPMCSTRGAYRPQAFASCVPSHRGASGPQGGGVVRLDREAVARLPWPEPELLELGEVSGSQWFHVKRPGVSGLKLYRLNLRASRFRNLSPVGAGQLRNRSRCRSRVWSGPVWSWSLPAGQGPPRPPLVSRDIGCSSRRKRRAEAPRPESSQVMGAGTHLHPSVPSCQNPDATCHTTYADPKPTDLRIPLSEAWTSIENRYWCRRRYTGRARRESRSPKQGLGIMKRGSGAVGKVTPPPRPRRLPIQPSAQDADRVNGTRT